MKTLFKRCCPACGHLALPVFSHGRKKTRRCTHCGAEFIEFAGSGCLIYPLILIIAFGSLFLGAFISEAVASTLASPWIMLILFVLAFLLPGYFLSATVPLRLSSHRDNADRELAFKDKVHRFPVVLIILAVLASLSLHHCSETFFPQELRELATRRENQLAEFRKVLQAYREEQGCYPTSLNELVPAYTDAVPAEIDPETQWQSTLYAIYYYPGDCEASFAWSRCNGPDCGSRFFVEKGEFLHDR